MCYRLICISLFLLACIGISSCEKCFDSFPEVRLNFQDSDRGEIEPNFSRVFSPDINQDFSFYPSAKIPIDMNASETRFVFVGENKTDTLVINHSLALDNINGSYCIKFLEGPNVNFQQTTFNTSGISVVSGDPENNENSLYEISITYP